MIVYPYLELLRKDLAEFRKNVLMAIDTFDNSLKRFLPSAPEPKEIVFTSIVPYIQGKPSEKNNGLYLHAIECVLKSTSTVHGFLNYDSKPMFAHDKPVRVKNPQILHEIILDRTFYLWKAELEES